MKQEIFKKKKLTGFIYIDMVHRYYDSQFSIYVHSITCTGTTNTPSYRLYWILKNVFFYPPPPLKAGDRGGNICTYFI